MASVVNIEKIPLWGTGLHTALPIRRACCAGTPVLQAYLESGYGKCADNIMYASLHRKRDAALRERKGRIMKNRIAKLVAVMLTMAMIAGCGGSGNQNASNEQGGVIALKP